MSDPAGPSQTLVKTREETAKYAVASQTLKHDVFVSYARSDDADGSIQKVISELERSQPELKFFRDLEGIRTGETIKRSIEDGLTNAVSFLAFVSPAYLRSPWCRIEWRTWTYQVGVTRLHANTRRILRLASMRGVDLAIPHKELASKLSGSEAGDPDQDDLETIAEILGAVQGNLYVSPDSPADLTKLAEDFVRDSEVLLTIETSPTTIPPYNWNFVGRREDLESLRDMLATGNRTGVIYGISGLGGIGKTELAIAYAYHFAANYPAGRFWIECEDRRSLQDALTSQKTFTRVFDPLNKRRKELENEPEEYYAEIMAGLQARMKEFGPALVVLDNVTDRAVLERNTLDKLGDHNGKLHILATTRRQKSSLAASWLNLQSLPKVEAVALLSRHRPFQSRMDREAAERIAEQLGGFTLAVELVGAYAALYELDYVRIPDSIRIPELSSLAGDPEIELRRHYQKGLASIMTPMICSLSPRERRALDYAALMPADIVPVSWIRDLAFTDFPLLRSEGAFPDPWATVVLHLRQRSIWSPSSIGEAVVRIHRLIQELVRTDFLTAPIAKLQEDLTVATIDRIRRWIDPEGPVAQSWELDVVDWLAGQWLKNPSPGAGRLLGELGQRVRRYGHSTQAESFLRKAMELLDLEFGPDNFEISTCLIKLAEWLSSSSNAEAEQFARRALDMEERVSDNDLRRIALAANALGQVLQAKGCLDEAEECYRKALDLDSKHYGPEHPLVTIRLNALAQFLVFAEKFPQALALSEQVLTIAPTITKADTPDIATSLSRLAGILRKWERFREAEGLYRKAISLDEAFFGLDSRMVAVRLSQLASVLRPQNKLSEAEATLRRALTIYAALSPMDHPDVATTLNELGAVLKLKANYVEAETLFLQALEIDENHYGRVHSQVARDLRNLAGLWVATNRQPEAEPLLERVREIESMVGAPSPEVAGTP